MRPAVIFIILTVMIDAMGIGLIIPVMPDLIAQVQSADLSRAALWGGVLATTFAVMQFLFSPLVGSLSDRFGRRPVLLTSLSVMARVGALVLFREGAELAPLPQNSRARKDPLCR